MEPKNIILFTDFLDVSRTSTNGTIVFVRLDKISLHLLLNAFIEAPLFLNTKKRFFIYNFKNRPFSLVVNGKDILSVGHKIEYIKIVLRASGEIVLAIKSHQPFSSKEILKTDYDEKNNFVSVLSRRYDLCEYSTNTKHLDPKKEIASICFREETGLFENIVFDFGHKISETSAFLFSIGDDISLYFNQISADKPGQGKDISLETYIDLSITSSPIN